jgi:hypothetical protein
MEMIYGYNFIKIQLGISSRQYNVNGRLFDRSTADVCIAYFLTLAILLQVIGLLEYPLAWNGMHA